MKRINLPATATSHYVDVDLSWLQATGQVRYVRSGSPTAEISNHDSWGKRYEKLREQRLVTCSKTFTGNEFPVDIEVKIKNGTIQLCCKNKYDKSVIDEVYYGLYIHRSSRTIRNWLYLQTRNWQEAGIVCNWLGKQITLETH